MDSFFQSGPDERHAACISTLCAGGTKFMSSLTVCSAAFDVSRTFPSSQSISCSPVREGNYISEKLGNLITQRCLGAATPTTFSHTYECDCVRLLVKHPLSSLQRIFSLLLNNFLFLVFQKELVKNQLLWGFVLFLQLAFRHSYILFFIISPNFYDQMILKRFDMHIAVVCKYILIINKAFM